MTIMRWSHQLLAKFVASERQRVEMSQILLHRCQQGGDETVDVGPGGNHRATNKLLNTSSLEMKLGYT
ncbi:hypothetical protein PoB_006204300 [Plakobranchus ocellatus]|uniref:Uncharacterized protein n=1 Tax=Plakobranchus ocellatus TaxID=259542 RepID=A0AAV4CUH9_9GAST|nr:hypothetical protein PoB_006204300 [Plakobranchus ocellatus]